MPSSSEAFGIYVHWPFCKAKCPYCDFNSHVRHQEVDTMSFAKALTAELRWFAGITPGRTVSSIFFGGGTPSLMPPAAVAEVIDQIAQLWPVADTVEITLEANPTSVEAENFRGYRTAGVNRVSVGVQALNENDLKALGRQHTPDEALKAFRLGGKNFSARLLRPDLCAAAADNGAMERRADAGPWRTGRPHVALPAHHRARHRLFRSAGQGLARCSR